MSNERIMCHTENMFLWWIISIIADTEIFDCYIILSMTHFKLPV